jgi:hypothetical protein
MTWAAAASSCAFFAWASATAFCWSAIVFDACPLRTTSEAAESVVR